MIRTLYFLLFSSLLICGCCKPGTALKQTESLNIQVQMKVLNSWLNLMPGTRKPSLYISADLEVINNHVYSLNEITIDKIEIVFDSAVFVFSYNEIEIRDQITALNPGTPKNFSIKAAKEINDKVSTDNPASVNFYFLSDTKMYKFAVTDIKIEKVY